MDNPVEEIKRKIDIVDFIGSYISLKKTGRNFKANCPFHQEKTPSFIVSPERQIWHCFGACNTGGDIIKFLMKWENITFYEALRDLAKKAGVKLARVSFEDNVWKKKQKLFEINHLAAQYYQFILEKTKYGRKAVKYLLDRGIKKETAIKFQLGYAPLSWDSLRSYFKRKQYSPHEVEETGLIIKGKRDYYDRFRGRLIFPIKNSRNEIIGFSGRLLDKEADEAKYINTPETLLYHKRETLYGIDLAREAMKKEGSVFLVEGEFDMISSFQHGVKNIVAIKGTAVTNEQLMLLKRYINRINFFLDADQAGEEAIKRTIEEVEKLDFETGVVTIDFGKDPDEAIRKDAVKFKQSLKKPVPIYDFLLNYLQKKYSPNEAFGKKKIGEEMVFYLEKIKNPIVQSHYLKKLASLIQVNESVIYSLIRKAKYKSKNKASFRLSKKEDKKEPRELVVQKYLLSFIFQDDDPYKIVEEINKIISEEDFSFPAFQKIWQIFIKLKKTNPDKFVLQKLVDSLPAQLQTVFDEVYLFASHNLVPKTNNIKKLAYELKKFSLKRAITELVSSQEEITLNKRKRLQELSKQLTQVEKTIILL